MALLYSFLESRPRPPFIQVFILMDGSISACQFFNVDPTVAPTSRIYSTGCRLMGQVDYKCVLVQRETCKYAVIRISGRRKEPSKWERISYRYSAPQSPIEVMIVRLLEWSKIASIAQWSCFVRWNPYTSWFSSGCSERPRRAPVQRNDKLRLRKKYVADITNDDSTDKRMV